MTIFGLNEQLEIMFYKKVFFPQTQITSKNNLDHIYYHYRRIYWGSQQFLKLSMDYNNLPTIDTTNVKRFLNNKLYCVDENNKAILNYYIDSLNLIDLHSGNLIKNIKFHDSLEIKMLFKANNKIHIITETKENDDFVLKLFQFDNDNKLIEFVMNFQCHIDISDLYSYFKISKNDKYFITWNEWDLCLYQTDDFQKYKKFDHYKVNPGSFLYDVEIDDKTGICVLAYDDAIILYDLNNDDYLNTILDTSSFDYQMPYKILDDVNTKPFKTSPFKVLFSNDSKNLLVSYRDGTIEKIDISNYTSVINMLHTETNTESIAFSGNKCLINVEFSTLNDLDIEVYDLLGGKLNIEYAISNKNKIEITFKEKIQSGVFLVKIADKNSIRTIKLLKID